MRRLWPAVAGIVLLTGCAGFDEPDLPPLAPVGLLERVPDPAVPDGRCLALSERVVTGRTFVGFARTAIRPTGRLFCPAPGVVVWDQSPPPS